MKSFFVFLLVFYYWLHCISFLCPYQHHGPFKNFSFPFYFSTALTYIRCFVLWFSSILGGYFLPSSHSSSVASTSFLPPTSFFSLTELLICQVSLLRNGSHVTATVWSLRIFLYLYLLSHTPSPSRSVSPFLFSKSFSLFLPTRKPYVTFTGTDNLTLNDLYLFLFPSFDTLYLIV